MRERGNSTDNIMPIFQIRKPRLRKVMYQNIHLPGCVQCSYITQGSLMHSVGKHSSCCIHQWFFYSLICMKPSSINGSIPFPLGFYRHRQVCLKCSYKPTLACRQNLGLVPHDSGRGNGSGVTGSQPRHTVWIGYKTPPAPTHMVMKMVPASGP